MKKILSFLFQTSFVACCSSITHSPVIAQSIATDGTLPEPTEVTPTDEGVEINGGTVRGDNLFHSFQDFSVPNGTEAHFNNNADVANILSRVTGGSISNIDGLIRANGSANLFLINPNGIIFDEGAQLDIGGSFLGSTADSLLLGKNGEFSANPQVKPILTINAPIGLNLRHNPQPITNQSTGAGLEVQPGKNITLVGGELNFDGGRFTAPGGKIELGGLSTAGKISISEDGSLTFPEDVARADITLSNGAVFNVSSTGGGDITVNASNLELRAGEDRSELRAGITADSTSNDAQAGDIKINLTDNLTIDDSRITNQVTENGIGNSGKIEITTGSIEVTNGGRIDSSTKGEGNAGSIDLTARDITFEGVINSDGNRSGVISEVGKDANGDAGEVNISANNLTLTNGGGVSATTKGKGNAGSIDITAKDIIFEGVDSRGNRSGASSRVGKDANGNAGDVTISANNLTLKDGGRVDSSTSGKGDAGLVDLTATGNIIFDGATSEGDKPNGMALLRSSATSRLNSGGEGNAGGVTISATNLTLTNGGRISASTSGKGNAGLVDLTATGNIIFDGATSEGDRSEATSRVDSKGVGDAGNVTISASNLTFKDGGRVDTSTSGKGNAGLVEITATESITFDGVTSEGDKPNGIALLRSGATSRVNSDGVGDAGNVMISANNLTLKGGGRVDSSTSGQGNAGSVQIDAEKGNVIIDSSGTSKGNRSGVTSRVNSEGVGDAGNVTISANNLTLRNRGRVESSTSGQGDAGSVQIDTTNSVNLSNRAKVAVNSRGQGDAGNLTIATKDLTLDSKSNLSAETVASNGGNIQLDVSNLLSLQDSIISTTAGSEGIRADGGNITINADFVVAIPSGDSDITANAFQGTGGAIKIDTQGIFGIAPRKLNPNTNDINASSDFDVDGNITVNTTDVATFQETAEPPANTVESDEVIARICDPTKIAEDVLAGDENTLKIQDRSASSSQPIDLLTSNNILDDTQSTLGDRQIRERKHTERKISSAPTPPILTAQGAVYPARGVVHQADGTVILTAQNTAHNHRVSPHSPNCG